MKNKYKNGSGSKMDEKINSDSKTIFNKKSTNDILEKLLWHNKPEIYYCNL